MAPTLSPSFRLVCDDSSHVKAIRALGNRYDVLVASIAQLTTTIRAADLELNSFCATEMGIKTWDTLPPTQE